MKTKEDFIETIQSYSLEQLQDTLYEYSIAIADLQQELEEEREKKKFFAEEIRKLGERNNSLILQQSDLETTIRTLIKIAKV